MSTCALCGKKDIKISSAIGLCADCIKSRQHDVILPFVVRAHEKSRLEFGLKPFPPRHENGVVCGECLNRCSIAESEFGYCNLRGNFNGRIALRQKGRGLLSWYHDPLPTNCVADWVCAGCSDAGYPDFSYSEGPEYGYKNLAVFFESCSLDCLFCQNWHFRTSAANPIGFKTPEMLAKSADARTSCVCFFGGDPSVQMDFAIEVSEIILNERRKDSGNRNIFRICWETNGMVSRKHMRKAVELSLESGGCIKFDLKAHSPNLYMALTGNDGREIYENFRFCGEFMHMRKDPPLLVASTLLVPGYIDSDEIFNIASFISGINPDIPYALLAFHPDYLMSDLPFTSREHAESCFDAARSAGLKNVKIGNIHILNYTL